MGHHEEEDLGMVAIKPLKGFPSINKSAFVGVQLISAKFNKTNNIRKVPLGNKRKLFPQLFELTTFQVNHG